MSRVLALDSRASVAVGSAPMGKAEAAAMPVTGDFSCDVAQAWGSLQAARDAMPEVGIDGWRAAYEETLPLVTNIRDLADVMRLKMEMALGEQELANPPRIGRPKKGHEARDPLRKAADMRTYRRTQLAKNKPKVEEYIRETLATRTRPTENGALKAADSPAAWKPREPKPKSKVRQIVRQPIPRHLPSELPIWAYLATLRKEIARRRKENHDHYKKSPWNPDAIKMRAQTELLDWIEEQLAVVPK